MTTYPVTLVNETGDRREANDPAAVVKAEFDGFVVEQKAKPGKG